MANNYRPLQAQLTSDYPKHSHTAPSGVSSYCPSRDSSTHGLSSLVTSPPVSNIKFPKSSEEAVLRVLIAPQRQSIISTTSPILREWVGEILSWLVSAACVAAIAIILRSYEGQRVPQWRFGIILNAIIAIFATIAKVALMNPVMQCICQLKCTWFASRERHPLDFQTFDQASRGEWGNFIFLIRLEKTYVSFHPQA
jgi:Protein of unknown function (DUF3176)